MEINNRKIGDTNPCYIIGEIGINHDGSLQKAKELIDMAADAGVDAVKFQTFKATDIINPTLRADYDPQEEVPEKYEFFHEYISEYELSYEDHDEIIAYCKNKNVEFISTPCSLEAVDFLATRVPAFKIASMDLNNIELLTAVGQKNLPVIISTGIGTLGEIEQAIGILNDNDTKEIALMHCISNYPADPKELNLKNIPMLKEAFGLPVGFSDHSLGINSSLAAVALGASIIEKHITLDRGQTGPDHSFALEVNDLKGLVSGIREVEDALGTSVRNITNDEQPKRQTYRRSLCVKKNVKANHRLSLDDIEIIRPGDGIDPFDIEKVEGLILKKDLEAYTPLKWEYFKET